jgi:hypothetical protein
MRLKYVLVLVVATIAYLAIGTFTVAVVPGRVIPLDSFGAVTADDQRLRLVLDAQNSVRSGAVALLSGSALGIAGLVTFLTFSYSRRESDRVHRTSQDTLFTSALAALSSDNDATVVGAASMISSLARIRSDLRRSASATLFALLREKCRVTNPIAATEANRSRAELHDRDRSRRRPCSSSASCRPRPPAPSRPEQSSSGASMGATSGGSAWRAAATRWSASSARTSGTRSSSTSSS